MESADKLPKPSKKEAFFQALAARVEEGKLRLVAEPLLAGAGSWQVGAQVDTRSALEISVYTDEATAGWLQKQDGMVRKQHIVLAGGMVKLQLNRGVLVHNGDPWPDMLLAQAVREAPFGEDKPFFLKRPLKTRHAIAVVPTENGRQGLVLGVEIGQMTQAMEFLKANGLAVERDVAIHAHPGSGTVWLGVDIASDIAASVAAHPDMGVERFAGEDGKALSDWVSQPPDTLAVPEAPEPEKPAKPEPRAPKEQPKPPAAPVKEALTARREAIREAGFRRTSRLMPNGERVDGIIVRDDADLRRIRDGLADPIRFLAGEEKLGQDGARFYPLSASEMQRLEDAAGALAEVDALAPDMRPIQKLLDRDKLRSAQVRRILFAEIGPEGERDHCLYIETKRQSYLSEVVDRLGLSGDQHAYVSNEGEQPSVLRVVLTQDAWEEARRILDVRREGSRHANMLPMHESLAPYFSQQAADHDVRVMAGLEKEEVATDKPTPAPPALKSGKEAEALFMDALAAFDPGQLLMARLKVSPKGEEPFEKTVLYINAPAQALGAFRNRLSRETSLWREKGEMHMVSGASEGTGAAINSFGLTAGILSALEGKGLPWLGEEPVSGNEAKRQVRQYFSQREQEAKQHDVEEQALRHLRTLPMVAVQVEAPDTESLGRVSQAIALLEPEVAQAQELVNGFGAFRAKVLEEHIKGKGERWPDDIRTMLARGRENADSLLKQSQGILQRIQDRVDAYRQEYAAVQARGVHTQYLLRNSPELREVLASLKGKYIEEMQPMGVRDGLLRLRLGPRGEQVVATRSRPLAWLEEPCSFDAMGQRISLARFDAAIAEEDAAHRLSMEPQPVRPEVDATPPAPTAQGVSEEEALLADDAALSARMPEHWKMLMPACKGFVAAQEGEGDEIRYVFAVAAPNMEELTRAGQLRLLFKQEGYLKEGKPGILYGENAGTNDTGALDGLRRQLESFDLVCRPMPEDKTSIEERGGDAVSALRRQLGALMKEHLNDAAWRTLLTSEPLVLFSPQHEKAMWDRMRGEGRRDFMREVVQAIDRFTQEHAGCAALHPWQKGAAPLVGVTFELTEEGARTLETHLSVHRNGIRFPLDEDRPVDRDTILSRLEMMRPLEQRAR